MSAFDPARIAFVFGPDVGADVFDDLEDPTDLDDGPRFCAISDLPSLVASVGSGQALASRLVPAALVSMGAVLSFRSPWLERACPSPRYRRRPRHHRVILVCMTHRVGPKGQVVIPKDLRDQLQIEPGDEVSFWREGDHVAVQRVQAVSPLRGRFAGSALTAELEEERRADRRREDG